MIEPVAIELNELADDALRAQHLRHRQDQVGCGHAFLELAVEAEADHLRHDHRDRLAEHRGLGLDTTDAPAQYAEAVDHRRVAVGAHERIGIGDRLAVLGVGPDGLGEILEIDLVADTRPRRDDPEVVEGTLAPTQELVALAVALELELDVLGERGLVAGMIDHHRVIDHQVDRRERVDQPGIAVQAIDRIAHGGQVDHGRDAGEVLHQDTGGPVGDLARRALLLQPVRKRLGVICRDRASVFVAEHVLQQHLQRIGQPRDISELLRCRFEAEIVVALARGIEGAAGLQAVLAGDAHGRSLLPDRELF